MKHYLEYIKIIIVVLALIVLIGRISSFIDIDLKVFFVDVGQGDCTVIITPQKKSIIIDGGEGHNDKYDMGKHVVLPYLLDRGIKSVDYLMISHFDSDHVGGLFSILEELKVKNVIISKQAEESSYFKDFIDVINNNDIKIWSVNCGERLDIEKDLYFHVLWPDENNTIRENVLNNNSIVCKLVYNDFSMLFTGDIERVAEEEIIRRYKGNEGLLNANVLKVAHHGSKTSSTENFIEYVKPQIALIGVGKNNKFGHPNDEIIDRFEENGIKVYRTDLNGEIMIEVSRAGTIKKSLPYIR